MIKKLLLAIFLVVNFFFANTVFGQAVGDYRSNVTAGNWITPSSWQICTSVSPISWTTATNYPGQIAGTYAVLIQTGNTITIGTADLTTQPIGTLTISGKLVLDGGSGQNTGGVFTINTQTIIVTAGGNISFNNQVVLALPTNATIQVGTGGLPTPGNGTCNDTIQISIGGVAYAYCSGGGQSNDFAELMAFGGSGSATSNSPVCAGNSINLSSTPPPNGSPFNYTWYEPAISNNPIGIGQSISISTGIVGTHIYKVGMYSTSLNMTMYTTTSVVVNSGSGPNAPTVGTITQPTCATPTGSVVLSGLPASGTWTLTRSPGAVATTGTGTSTTISELASGNYTYTVSNGSCTSGASNNVTINSTTNTWNVVSGVGSWTNTLTSTQAITFNGDYNSTGDLTACSCTVNSGVSVNINSGHTLNLTNGLTVATTATMTFFNNASLVQIYNVANSGEIDYVRTTNTNIYNTDYTYWSSPVYSIDQTLGYLSPFTLDGMMYSYNSSIDDWNQESLSTVMLPGNGYIVRGPEPGHFPPNTQYTATFTGVPNNGDKLITGIIADKSYLLGNPYPSAINADIFLTANSGVLNGTLYFWTHNTAIQAANAGDLTLGSGAYAYTSNDYATYNITGGVGIDSGAVTSSAPSGGAKPNGFISAGQGFFASSKTSLSGSKIVFDNIMRLAGTTMPDGSGVNQQFFKSRNPKVKPAIEKNRIWLNLTNTQGAFKQTLVGYVTDATNEYDSRFDGESFDGNEFVDFYSVNKDKNLVIQGRALPFDDNDEVPLGYRTTINGDFTINIDQVDGSLTNQAVYIEDKLTNTVFDLKSGNYTFNTVAGAFNDRFVLKYKDNSTAKTLATANFDSQSNKVLVSSKNKQIKINSFAETIDKVTIYDVLGKQIYQKDKVNSNELSIANLVSSRQTLIVKTVLQNGSTETDKIIY